MGHDLPLHMTVKVVVDVEGAIVKVFFVFTFLLIPPEMEVVGGIQAPSARRGAK